MFHICSRSRFALDIPQAQFLRNSLDETSDSISAGTASSVPAFLCNPESYNLMFPISQYGVKGQASEERFVEITPGEADCQLGLTATGKDCGSERKKRDTEALEEPRMVFIWNRRLPFCPGIYSLFDLAIGYCE